MPQTDVEPLASDHLTRQSEAPLPYPRLWRLLDRMAGRRDGRDDARDERVAWRDEDDDGGEPQAVTMWLEMRRSSFDEIANQELLKAQAIEAPRRARLDEIDRVRADARAELQAAEAALAAVPTEPEVLSHRGPAESGDTDEQVAIRRRREHHRRAVAPAEGRVAAARAKVEGGEAERARLIAQILAARDVAVRRVARELNLAERRGATYRRGWIRAWQRQSSGMPAPQALLSRSLFTVPPWVTEHLQNRPVWSWTPETPDRPNTPSTEAH